MSFLLVTPYGGSNHLYYGEVSDYWGRITHNMGIFRGHWKTPSITLPFIKENLKMETKTLDRPSLHEFKKEVKRGYDFVGISFNTMDFEKAEVMIKIVKDESPNSKILLGGAGVYTPGVEKLGAHKIFKGRALKSLRNLFGEDVNAPIKHPLLKCTSWFDLPFTKGESCYIYPSFGCIYRCEFCPSGFMFGREDILNAEQIYDLIIRSRCKHTFIIDENFFINKKRVLDLLELMRGQDLFFSAFGSLKLISKLNLHRLSEHLVGVYVGVESKFVKYDKLKGTSTKGMIKRLQDYGIIVLSSHLLGLDIHNKKKVEEEVDYAFEIDSDAYQFSIITPFPATKMFEKLKSQNRLLKVPWSHYDCAHLVFKHPYLEPEWLREFLYLTYEKLPVPYIKVFKRFSRSLLDVIHSSIRQTGGIPVRKEHIYQFQRKLKNYGFVSKMHLPVLRHL